MKTTLSAIIRITVRLHQRVSLKTMEKAAGCTSLFIWGLVLLLCIGCQRRKFNQLTAINEMAPCEENNIFYKIIEVQGSEYRLETLRDSLVLFEFVDSLDSKINYDKLWPDPAEKRRLKVMVYGYFSGDRVGANNPYGCTGGSVFKISAIRKIDDVTDTEIFSIDNNE